MSFGEILGIWLAAGLTLMFFSFIYRDNLLFKFGEHLYLGVSVGYYVNIQYWNVLVPDVYRPLVVDGNYWILVPAILGALLLLRLVPTLAWMSRTSFAVYIGGAAGLAIPYTISSLLLPQLSRTLAPFGWNNPDAVPAGSSYASSALAGDINQLLILIGVFAVLTFFFFSLEHKKLMGGISRIGLLYIMISFGASFGFTVMARVSLLIGRFQFLIEDWIRGVILRQG